MSHDTGSIARNLESVQEIYAAFDRGDINAILDRLAAEVQWEARSRAFATTTIPPRTSPPPRAQASAYFAVRAAASRRAMKAANCAWLIVLSPAIRNVAGAGG